MPRFRLLRNRAPGGEHLQGLAPAAGRASWLRPEIDDAPNLRAGPKARSGRDPHGSARSRDPLGIGRHGAPARIPPTNNVQFHAGARLEWRGIVSAG
jgi:hypothetical protein